jgi:hypothetical protein
MFQKRRKTSRNADLTVPLGLAAAKLVYKTTRNLKNTDL